MTTFDVQGVEVAAAPDAVYGYLADAGRLPEWTEAFEHVSGGRARMHTPSGSTDVDLIVRTSVATRCVDWEMRFENGETAFAWARVVPHRGGALIAFILSAPPVPLEQLEGSLAEQSRTLTRELQRLAECVTSRETAAR